MFDGHMKRGRANHNDTRNQVDKQLNKLSSSDHKSFMEDSRDSRTIMAFDKKLSVGIEAELSRTVIEPMKYKIQVNKASKNINLRL